MIFIKTVGYSYDILKDELLILKERFPFVKTGIIGKSVWGLPLEYIKIGTGKNKIFYNGTHHGLEHLTSHLLMKFCFHYLECIQEEKDISGISARSLFQKSSLYIVPMVNPDGADLSLFGFSSPYIKNKDYLRKINPDGDFSFWQANARGVDLNHNYDALFHLSKESEVLNNIKGPGPTRYSGEFPESEPETKAVADFTREKCFDLAIAFHSQGKVIYYDFNKKEPDKSLEIARLFEELSGYKIDYTEGMASFSGYKDWFIDKFNKPGFTIEIGEGKNPLNSSQLPEIYNDLLPLLTHTLNLSF